MNKKVKKIVAGTLAVATVAVLCGCGKSETQSVSADSAGAVQYSTQPAFVGNPDETYAFVSWYAGNEWWVGGYEGFKDAARELGVKTVCTGATDDGIDTQIAALQQEAAKKPAGICLAVSDGSAFGNTVQEIIDSGIPVTTTDNQIPDADTLMFMGYNDKGMTKLVSDHIGIATNGQGKMAMLEVVGQKNLEERAAAFKDNLAKDYPGVQIVATANSGQDENKAASDASSILAKYPDLDFIYTLNATEAMGAVTAVKEAGSSCRVITMDVNENVLDYIKDGKIDAAVMPDSYTFGYVSMLALYCEAHNLMDPMWKGSEGKTNWCVPSLEVGSTLVTKDNADKFYTSKYYESRDSKGFDEGAEDMKKEDLPGYWKR